MATLLLLLLYLGCQTKTPEHLQLEAMRQPEAAGESLLRAAREALTPAQLADVSTLEDRLESRTDEDNEIDLLQQLSGTYYRAGRPEAAGYYARRLAEVENTEEAWSIAGTTFSLCTQKYLGSEEEDGIRQQCAQEAVAAYEAAISLNPDELDHRVNLALIYVDNPPEGNPMKGILDLVGLDKEYPREPRVLVALGRLAIRTGQWERAEQRLSVADEIEPDYPGLACLLAQTYQQLGQADKEQTYAARCNPPQ